MDKKSLDRLLDKLAKGGFLKNIIVKLKSKTANVTKQVRYVVHPSITFGESSCVRGCERDMGGCDSGIHRSFEKDFENLRKVLWNERGS